MKPTLIKTTNHPASGNQSYRGKLFLFIPMALLRGFIFLILAGFIVGCAGDKKNIIIVIGDGMGAEQRKAAQWVLMGEAGKLSMDDMPARGWSQTSSAYGWVTDSAAAATAMATGVKTGNGVIGLDKNLKPVTTILETARAQGKMVGLVTTDRITDATPAAFAAHVPDRNLMTQTAEQLLAAGVDVMLGGGEGDFLPESTHGCFQELGKRKDDKNLIKEAIYNGYTHVCDQLSFAAIDPSSTHRLLGLFASEDMKQPFSPSLVEMTKKAIDLLSNSPNGFFLMIEGAHIDNACHSNDAAASISNTIALDDVVRIIKDFALIESNTLVIVTADHETGGMNVALEPRGLDEEDGPFYMPDGTPFYVNWATTHHTASDVPVTAQGPLSEQLIGRYENTLIYDVMRASLDKKAGD